jgi:hypothetical protein
MEKLEQYLDELDDLTFTTLIIVGGSLITLLIIGMLSFIFHIWGN